MKFFQPTALRERVTDISPDLLKSLGVKALLLDVDNTLATYTSHTPSQGSLEWVRAMEDAGIAPKRLRTVHGMPGRAPKFLLIEGVRGGGPGLHWLPPLVLREADGSFSEEWKRIYRAQ